jgi:signal transduction histidine kinase
LGGETVRENSVRLESDGVTTYWDVVLAPLLENDEIAGILNVAVDVTEREESRLNLEKRVTERTRELQTLLDVTATASSSLNFDEMLTTTLDLLVGLVDASRAGVILRDDVSGELRSHLLRPEREIVEADLEMMVEACETVIVSGEPLYVAPNIELGFLEPGVLLPLKIRNQMLGVLVIIGSAGRYFSDQELALFKSIAEQMSVAVENTRLYEKAEQMAVASERSRLARDLHDAVTQTLFSSNLIAEVLPKIWERDPQVGRQKLEELRQLTRGALSEMRTMLMELRPSALAEADMDELFGHLVNAFVGRSRLKVHFEAQGEGTPPVEVKEVFYRVAQESLNNIEKHANAREVLIQLSKDETHYELIIKDDGSGFNMEAVSQDHLGLGIMQERAESIGALLTIESSLDNGTMVRLNWESEEKHNDK